MSDAGGGVASGAAGVRAGTLTGWFDAVSGWGGGDARGVDGGNSWRSAASTVVMRSGRHFPRFTVISDRSMMLAVLRPGWDVEGGVGAFNADGHCFYFTANGWRCPGNRTWEGV